MDAGDTFERIDRLLDEAIALDPLGRKRLVAELAQTEPALAEELSSLIRHVDPGIAFLERPISTERRERLLKHALGLGRLESDQPPEHVGEAFGAYRAVEEIGRGLRSVVYRACRVDEEWSQEVAVKVLVTGVDSDDVLRRFLVERQILTVLRHPNIATLLDGGISRDGSPYFVMEYVDGLPVTEYCRENRLSLRDRVRLCRQICAAMAYAHRHMVVHRDLKPSNILVDAEGRIKLLDFGIAKLLAGGPDGALDPDMATRTLEVVHPMTPRYASPEQFGAGTVTTATDVYQLGLLFTEMLAGTGNARDMLGIASQGRPKSFPSRLASGDGEALPYTGRELRGDLDWILLKALESEPENRYASAADLGADFESYANSRPVRARKATAAYVLRKFIRRHPVRSAALGVLVVAVVSFVAALSHFNRQLDAERAAAVEAAALAEEVKNVLVGFIRSPDPYAGAGADARVSDVLVQSERQVDNDLAGRPELQAELYAALGDVYQGLAMHDRAIAMRDREMATRERLQGVEPLTLWRLRRKRAESLMAAGDTDRAITELRALRDRLAEEAPDAWTERAIVSMEIGSYHVVYGQAEDGLPYLESAVEMADRAPDNVELAADTRHALSVGLDHVGRYQEAHRLLLRADGVRVAALGADHVQTLLGRARIAANLSNQTRYDESIAIYRELLPAMEERLGPLHEEVTAAMNNLAFSLDLAGRLEESAEIHLEVLDRRRRKSGDRHRDVADSLQNVGSVLKRIDRRAEAVAALEEAAAIYLDVNEPGQPRTAYPHVSLAIIYADAGPIERQERHARRAIALLEDHVAADHPALLRSRCLLGDALVRQGDRATGLPLLRAGVDGLARHSGLYETHLHACREALARALPAQSSPRPD